MDYFEIVPFMGPENDWIADLLILEFAMLVAHVCV